MERSDFSCAMGCWAVSARGVANWGCRKSTFNQGGMFVLYVICGSVGLTRAISKSRSRRVVWMDVEL